MLDAEHNFARPVPRGREVASWTSWVSVKPRSKPAGDTTCKTDTRVWPHRKSNKLQWADVFCSHYYDAAITMRSAETELQNTIELRATGSEIAAPKPDLDARAKKRRF